MNDWMYYWRSKTKECINFQDIVCFCEIVALGEDIKQPRSRALIDDVTQQMSTCWQFCLPLNSLKSVRWKSTR